MEAQVLDSMDLERERGITIKAHAVRLTYKADDGKTYMLNLIDTPGHVDFSYEVTRSLAACEGALLLVDASQGVEAQTLANAYLAVENNLEIIPVINKIDLPGAQPDEAKRQIEEIVGLDASGAILASAKEGTGVHEILEAIVKRLPPPTGDPDGAAEGADLRLVVRPLPRRDHPDARHRRRDSRGHEDPADGAGAGVPSSTRSACSRPSRWRPTSSASARSGFIFAGIKTVSDAQIGDTITEASRPTSEPFPGFKESKPMVFAGLYPVEGSEYPQLRDALEKLRLNDASFFFEPETSAALGFGFRCGFLGLLHMEIVQERLEREFDMDLVTTAPGVSVPRDHDRRRRPGDRQPVEAARPRPDREDRGAGDHRDDADAVRARRRHPAALPGKARRPEVDRIPRRRPRAGDLRAAVQRSRAGLLRSAEDDVARLRVARLPRDRLPGSAAGQAGHPGERGAGRRAVDASSIATSAYQRGRALASKMRELIPRQMFEVAIQAAIGSRIIARESVKALRKNVLAKCYGGDISRKRKLLEKQKEGKKRMKRVGRVEIPQEAFLAVLKVGHGSRRHGRATFQKSTLREYLESIVIAVILALFVRTWVVQAFKIPTGSMENNLLIGDHLLVNKFVFGPTASRSSARVLPVRDIRARRHRRLQVSGRTGPRLHQARDRPARRDARTAGTRRCTSDGQPLDEPYVHFLEPASRVAGDHVVRRARAVRAGARSRGAVLRDGGQSRQLAGQPLLGFPAARLHQGPRADDLLVVRIRARGLPGRRRRRDGQAAVLGRDALLHQDALGAAVPPDSLTRRRRRPMIRKMVKLAVFLLIANAVYQVAPGQPAQLPVQGCAAGTRRCFSQQKSTDAELTDRVHGARRRAQHSARARVRADSPPQRSADHRRLVRRVHRKCCRDTATSTSSTSRRRRSTPASCAAVMAATRGGAARRLRGQV